MQCYSYSIFVANEFLVLTLLLVCAVTVYVHFDLQGAGCALMGRATRFEGIVRGMVEVLDCPLTVKMRTGIYNKNWTGHKLIPKLRDWGVSVVTVCYHWFYMYLISMIITPNGVKQFVCPSVYPSSLSSYSYPEHLSSERLY